MAVTDNKGGLEMPRLKRDIDRDFRWSIVAGWETRNGYKDKDIARVWGCAPSTVSDMKKRPERLTIEKIAKMKLDKDELYRLVYCTKS